MDRQNTGERLANGRWAIGNPGKPRGARHKFNGMVLDAIGDLTSLSVKVLRDNLEQGNVRAAMYCLDRFLPEHRSIEIQSSEPSAWADALAAGEITPSEAAKAAQALKTFGDATIVVDLQARLDELEARFQLGGSGRG